MEALEIYKKLSQPPKTALREIQEGTLKGKTDINPQWRYEAMTETFGLVGIGWKYEIQKLWNEPGANGEILAFAQVAVYIRDKDTKEWSDAIVGIGGSKLVNQYNKGPKSNDEGYKMAVTDAFSTSLKMIGVAADIYAGRWDGSKYCENGAEPGNKNASNEPQPKGGQDTKEEHDKINMILGSTYPNGAPIFTQQDIKTIPQMRIENTASETIELLRKEVSIRLQKAGQGQGTKAPLEYKEDLPFTSEEEAGASKAFDGPIF